MFKRFFLVLLAGTLLGGIPVMAAALENETAGAIVREPVLTGEQGVCMRWTPSDSDTSNGATGADTPDAAQKDAQKESQS